MRVVVRHRQKKNTTTMKNFDSTKLKAYYSTCGILNKWHDVGFSDFTNDEEAKEKVLKYLGKIHVARKEGYGLYLWGGNGRGKTHIMMCLLKDILQLGYTARSIQLGDLIKLYTAEHWYNGGAEWTDIVQRTDFLEIEEVGKEYKGGDGDLGRLVLDSTIRYRTQAKKPILFTTNKTPKELDAIYGESITSMLAGSCRPIIVKGEDFRRTKDKDDMMGTLDF